MTKRKKTESAYLAAADYLTPPMLRLIEQRGIYMGVCVMQTPAAWTRVGPTWHIPGHAWVCVGPGIFGWGTTQGLAELASAVTGAPKFHAAAAGVCPQPNILFSCVDSAIDHLGVRGLADSASEVRCVT